MGVISRECDLTNADPMSYNGVFKKEKKFTTKFKKGLNKTVTEFNEWRGL